MHVCMHELTCRVQHSAMGVLLHHCFSYSPSQHFLLKLEVVSLLLIFARLPVQQMSMILTSLTLSPVLDWQVHAAAPAIYAVLGPEPRSSFFVKKSFLPTKLSSLPLAFLLITTDFICILFSSWPLICMWVLPWLHLEHRNGFAFHWGGLIGSTIWRLNNNLTLMSEMK